MRGTLHLLFGTAMVAGLVAVPLATGGAGGLAWAAAREVEKTELPYLLQLRNPAAPAPKPQFILRASPKFDLVMLVAARVDHEKTINVPTPGNRLGGYWQANTRQFGYEDAPRRLQDLQQQGLWRDRLLEFALHLSDPPALERVLPWSEALLKAVGASTAPAGELDQFLQDLRNFADKARFSERFAEKSRDYAEIESLVRGRLGSEDPLRENASFWGVEPAGDYYLIPSPVINTSYVASLSVGRRRHEFLAFGPATEEAATVGILRHLAYHEMSHPLVDPILKEHEADFEGSKPLYFPISGSLPAHQPKTWIDTIGEHLLRAYNIRHQRQTDPIRAELLLTSEAAGGYPYIRAFSDLLEEFASNRQKYPTLASYVPEVARKLKTLAANPSELDPWHRTPSFELEDPGFEASGPSAMFQAWELVPAGRVAADGARAWGRVARDLEVKHGGLASLRIINDGKTTDLIGLEQGPLAVHSGATVRLSAWVRTDGVKREGGQQKVCGLYVLFYDREGKVLSRGETDSAVGTLDWTRLSGEFSAPTGTQRATVGILHGMSGTAWFDDLSFEKPD